MEKLKPEVKGDDAFENRNNMVLNKPAWTTSKLVNATYQYHVKATAMGANIANKNGLLFENDEENNNHPYIGKAHNDCIKHPIKKAPQLFIKLILVQRTENGLTPLSKSIKLNNIKNNT